MFNSNRRGRPEEEMFIRKPDLDTPTVEPLRIHKRESLSPQSTGSTSRADQSSSQAGTSGPKPALPYPNDEPARRASPRPGPSWSIHDQTQPEGSRPGSSRTPPPALRPHFPGSSETSSAAPARQSQRQPHRDEHDSPTLAQRRGTAPLPFPESPTRKSQEDDGLFAKRPQREGQTRKASTAESTALNPYPEYHQQYWPPPVTASSKRAPSAGLRQPDPAPVSRLDSTASISTTRAERGSPPPPPPTNRRESAGAGVGVGVGAGAGAGAGARAGATLAAPQPTGVNRLNSVSSTYTTRAERGSPPPPETPVTPAGAGPGDLESRYAAAGIAGAATLNSIQSQNSAAAQRANHYSATPPPGQSGRPWTPTEPPGSHPFGPPTVYQGPSEVPTSAPSAQAATDVAAAPGAANRAPGQAGLEEDMQRMQMNSSPPPAYSSVPQNAPPSHGYPNEKAGSAPTATTNAAAGRAAGFAAAALPASNGVPAAQGPPAAQTPPLHDPRLAPSPQPVQDPNAPIPQIVGPHADHPGPTPASPPPLPEGWIAHLDPNSGQYYYIHLRTQATQWEFPKGPTPLNLSEPLSPTHSTYAGHALASPGLSAYGGQPLGSPGFPSPGYPPMTPGYPESIMSVGAASTMTTGITGPPPVGIEMYKIAPTNGVYFGPYLRYINMDLERGLWLGSIMLVTDAAQPPTIHIHQSVDLSPNPRQLKAVPIHTHQRWIFYRYDVDLQMEDEAGAKWTYAITSHLGCTRYEFLVAGRYETSWRFVAHSGNDFSMNVSANDRQRLGGVGYLWKDLLQKHVECGGFHVQLGLGDQIYGDRIWREIPLLKQWLGMSGKENRRNAPWTAKHDEEATHAFFHYYTSHFDQPQLREAFAQIPHVLQIDDHDIFDGYGSYPDYMQYSHMFKNIGRIGIEMYLLFQHHANYEILRGMSNDQDIFTVTGTGWHFIKYLGPAVVVVGADCRSERNQHQVMAGPTYQGLFPKVATLPPSVQHCIWMISVPLIYPRLEAAESLANTVATGKKAVTGAYNMLGRVTSSVAGVVGAKSAVGEGFNSVKRAVGKSGLMGTVLSPFGDIDVLDELRDQWTHESKDLERTYFIRTLQGIAHQKSIRMTFFSGDVNCCGAGLVHDPAHPSDHKTMYQVISSSIVSAPPPNYVVKLLHSNKPLYVPQNGHRSTNAPSDTKEDMLEIFKVEVNGVQREHRRLMARRNYVACVAFDPDLVGGGAAAAASASSAASMSNGYGPTKGTLSLAIDFMVQGEGIYGTAIKYGPVVIPSLEFGR
ncbi:MAG: hypothetical protein M1815_002213 [Lichina confinis]|nr:MAG: hypothetical protein M1815_002213 [Lichina confinis]